MRSSRFGQPVLESSSASAGKSSRWPEISTIEASPRRSNGSSSTPSSKRKKSSRPSTSSAAVPSSSQARNKGPARLSGIGYPTATVVAMAEDNVVAAIAKSELHACALDYEQAIVGQRLESDCSWPNWPDCGNENQNFFAGQFGPPTYSDTSSSYWGSEKHCERDGVSGQIWRTSQSEAFNSSSLSNSEFDLAWSTSSSRGHEMRKTYSFWEDFIWGERRTWKKLRHKKSFLTNLWDFKPETKVEESCDPILVSVNVLGSPGPLRLVVDKNDSVRQTIDFALRRYTAQKREPTLVDPAPFFGLYCHNPDFEALDNKAPIGDRGSRQLYLYHKHRKDLIMDSTRVDNAASCKSNGITTLIPSRNWIWSNINGMRSWAGGMVAAILKTVACWVKCFNPKRFYRFMYMVFLLSLGRPPAIPTNVLGTEKDTAQLFNLITQHYTVQMIFTLPLWVFASKSVPSSTRDQERLWQSSDKRAWIFSGTNLPRLGWKQAEYPPVGGKDAEH